MNAKARIIGVLVMALMLSGYTEKCTMMTAPPHRDRGIVAGDARGLADLVPHLQQ